MFTIFLVAIFHISAQTTYYVSWWVGVDNATCGGKNSPCSFIRQVLKNHPGESYIVSVSVGQNLLNEISLEKSAKVIFQGAGAEYVIYTPDLWSTGNYINHTLFSGFEFHDVSLDVRRNQRGYLTYLESEGNAVGFYNVDVTCDQGVVIVGLTGGVVVMSNCSFSEIFSYIVIKNNFNNGTATSVNITGCTFTDVINAFGGVIYLTGPGLIEMVLDKSSFFDVLGAVHFITADIVDAGSKVTVTNNLFNNTGAFRPSICIGLAQYKYDITVRNTTFFNCTSGEFFSGGLSINRSDPYSLDGSDVVVVDNPVTLEDLRFENCLGVLSGGLFVGYNSFVLLRSSFVNNRFYVDRAYSNISATDIFFAVFSMVYKYEYSIVDCYSASNSERARVYADDTDSITNISYTLPDPVGNGAGGGGDDGKKADEENVDGTKHLTIALVIVVVVGVLVVIGVTITILLVWKRRNAPTADGAVDSGYQKQGGK